MKKGKIMLISHGKVYQSYQKCKNTHRLVYQQHKIILSGKNAALLLAAFWLWTDCEILDVYVYM